jgi:hypothetical protein
MKIIATVMILVRGKGEWLCSGTLSNTVLSYWPAFILVRGRWTQRHSDCSEQSDSHHRAMNGNQIVQFVTESFTAYTNTANGQYSQLIKML